MNETGITKKIYAGGRGGVKGGGGGGEGDGGGGEGGGGGKDKDRSKIVIKA